MCTVKLLIEHTPRFAQNQLTFQYFILNLAADGNNVETMKNTIIKKTPDGVLKILATANVLNKQHRLLPYIAQYFLPTGKLQFYITL